VIFIGNIEERTFCHISGIENGFDIKRKCRLRIKGNNPTAKITTN